MKRPVPLQHFKAVCDIISTSYSHLDLLPSLPYMVTSCHLLGLGAFRSSAHCRHTRLKCIQAGSASLTKNDNMARKVLIIGATGTIGTHITTAIANASSQFEKVAIFTSPATAEGKKGVIEELKRKNVEIITGDINDDEQLKKALSGRSRASDKLSLPLTFLLCTLWL